MFSTVIKAKKVDKTGKYFTLITYSQLVCEKALLDWHTETKTKTGK